MSADRSSWPARWSARLREGVPPGAETVVVVPCEAMFDSGAPLAAPGAGSPEASQALAGTLEALGWTLERLSRHGIERGRRIVVVPFESGVALDHARAFAARIADRHGGIALVHDPSRSECYRAGRTPEGIEVALNDVLREAEALIVIGRRAPGESDAALDRLLVPGLASLETCRALEDARSDAAWHAARSLVRASCVLALASGRDARGANA